MKRTNILAGVLSVFLLTANGFSYSNDTTVVFAKTETQLTIDISDPYRNLPTNDQFYPCLEILAQKLNVDKSDLFALINFETGGRIDPTIKNRSGSSAKGLLQFTDASARKLKDKNGHNLKSSAHLIKEYPTIKDQMEIPTKHNKYGGPVYQYLNMLAPYKSSEDLFMAVMYPPARKTGILPKHISVRNAGIKSAKQFASMARRKAADVSVSYD